jgi:hypothetical protein
MKAATKRAQHRVSMLLAVAGLMCWLILPGLPIGRAISAHTASTMQSKPGTGLDAERQSAIENLYAQSKSGAPFSLEEQELLRKFAAGEVISELEADTLISRALYDYYVAGKELTREQHDLLGRYSLHVARRSTDVRDQKMQAMSQRIAAYASEPSRNAPLAPPANDTCAGAIIIPAAGPFPVNTTPVDVTDATVGGDPPSPSCFVPGTLNRSIWYRFTPSTTATYTLTTCASDGASSSLDDPIMAVYTSTGGCAGPFTEIPTSGPSNGCNDDGCVSLAFQPVIITQLNAGTQYYIVIWDVTPTPPPAGANTVQLIVRQAAVPGNDSCATPTALTLSTPITGSSQGATNDYQLSGAACFTGVGQISSNAVGRDVVYSFTATTAGTYSFKVTNYFNPFTPGSVSSNLVLYVASTCQAATPGTPVTVGTCLGAANRSATSTSEEVMCVSLAGSQQVFVFVDESAFTTDGSTFTLEVTRCVRETEPNNTPATANTLTFGMEGSIGVNGDVDFFSLGTPAAGSRVFALIDGVSSNSTDYDLRVTTSTDTLEYDDLNAPVEFGTLSATVGGTPATGVSLFLRVDLNSFSPIAAEPYRIYYAVQPPGANAVPDCPSVTTSATPETEPNNTTAQANSAANNFFSGALAGPSPSTDTDIYSFAAVAGDVVFLSVDGDPCRNNTPINPALALLNSAGTQLIAVNDSSSSACNIGDACDTGPAHPSLTSITPSTTAESLAFRIPTTGTYFARVTNATALAIDSGAGNYLLSITTARPTAAKFNNDDRNGQAKALRYEDGVSVQWRTGFEVDNLGFNIYREEGNSGRRVRVNQQLIAGSALMVGSNTALGAGKSYAWFDSLDPNKNAQYWIEAIDLDGKSSWHGPVAITRATGMPGPGHGQAQSATLGELGKGSALAPVAAGIDSKAQVVSAAASTLQPDLAGGAAVKMSVRAEGLYRVTQAELLAAGLDPKVDPRMLQLYADGQVVPLNFVSKGGAFDSSSAIEFYGLGVDSPFTDARVYWLVAQSQPGRRMQQVPGATGQITQGSFLHTVELRERTVYFSSLRNGDVENFFGAVVGQEPVDQALTIGHVDKSTAGGGTLEVALQGVTQVSHRVQVQINGVGAGVLTFNGQDQGIARLAVSQLALKEGANTVRLISQGGPSDISLVDYVRLTYWHSYVADNNQLRFTAAGKQVATVDGFSNAGIRVFDVTDVNAVQEVAATVRQTKSGYAVSVNPPGAGQRTLLAMTGDLAKRVSSAAPNQPSNWRQPSQAGSLVIITRRDFFSALQPLVDYRTGQGYKVALVDIEDVYDEFSFGNKTPLAIKDFLAYAAANWTIKPAFVLLAADASLDPKNYLGFGDNDLVPTKLIDTQLMETASDDWLADVNLDGAADLAVGRLPVRNAREAATLAAKIVAYEQNARPQGALLVTDDNEEFDFEVPSRELRSLIPANVRTEEINRGRMDAAAARSLLLSSLNKGPRIVNYNGHANIDGWRGGLLTSADAISLSNGDSLSLFVMMTCLNGYFQDAQLDSLAESLMKAERGGAIAVWASSGMTGPGDQAPIDLELFKRLFDSNASLTLGEATARAKTASKNRDVSFTWILFGDPTTRLKP